MFIDYGSASGVHFGNFERATPTTGRIRFVEHTIDDLEKTYGMKSIDVAMPSHMHDDHMNGFPYLIGHQGTKVWCLDNMVDIFREPARLQPGLHPGRAVQSRAQLPSRRTIQVGGVRIRDHAFTRAHRIPDGAVRHHRRTEGGLHRRCAVPVSGPHQHPAAQHHLPESRRERQPSEVDPQHDRPRAHAAVSGPRQAVRR